MPSVQMLVKGTVSLPLPPPSLPLMPLDLFAQHHTTPNTMSFLNEPTDIGDTQSYNNMHLMSVSVVCVKIRGHRL